MKKLFIILLLALFFTGCIIEEETAPGVDYIPVEDDDDRLVNTYNFVGLMEKGPCPEGGSVMIQPVDRLNMYQSGEGPFFGFTYDDYGRYYIPAEIEQDSTADVWAEVFFKGDCHNELTGGYDHQEFSAIINIDDEENNINPLTDVRSFVARWLFGDPLITQIYGPPEPGTEGNPAASIALAEIMIIDFLQMPSPDKKFTEMTLQNADIGDAILALFNSMVLNNDTLGPGKYLTKIAGKVIENDLEFKTEIQETFNILPLLQIKNNLEARYLELGMDISSPPIWRLGAPDYYADLLERVQIIQGSFNLEDSATCSCDAPYKRYAIPHILQSWIQTTNYLATNFGEGKTVSIWSRGVHGGGYDAPGIKLLTVSELREKLLDSDLGFHGELGAHGLSTGDEVYFMIESDTAWALSVGCDGGALPFGRKLASNDGGVTYVGFDNVTAFFTKSGLNLTGIN